MTFTELIDIGKRIVEYAKSREYKNQYTQGERRWQVATGWSDCSTYVRWCYLQATGLDIGGNTAAQITSKKYMQTVDIPIVNGVPDLSQLLEGDLLYFRGVDESRKWAQYVGHVEMYRGNGQLTGHGGGLGATVKNLVDYCKMRQGLPSPGKIKNRGLICVRRLKLNSPIKAKRPAIPEAGYKQMTVTTNGGNLNVREQASTNSKIVAKLANGAKVNAKEATKEWFEINNAQVGRGYVFGKWLK